MLRGEGGTEVLVDASLDGRDELGEPDVLGGIADLGDGSVFEVGACVV